MYYTLWLTDRNLYLVAGRCMTDENMEHVQEQEHMAGSEMLKNEQSTLGYGLGWVDMTWSVPSVTWTHCSKSGR